MYAGALAVRTIRQRLLEVFTHPIDPLTSPSLGARLWPMAIPSGNEQCHHLDVFLL